MPNEPSGQVAAPTQATARVRFEFAGRAHRREFTPKLEIKRKENKVKEKEENFGKKSAHGDESGGGKVEILHSKGRGAQDDMVAVMARDGFRGALRWVGGRPWKAVPTKATASPFTKR
jgi:hypothetical protein